MLVLNIPLFLYGWKKQDTPFTVYAIYTVSICSLMAWLITDALPIDVYMAASKTVDFIVEGFDRAKAAIIITVRPDEICDTLSRFDIKNLPAKDSSSEKVPLK